MKKKKSTISRRDFLSNSAKTALGTSLALSFPSIVPASVFGKNAPSNRINIGAIGTGRISRGHDLPGVWRHDFAQVVAVCDLDTNRAEEGKILVNDYYTKRDGKPYDGVKVYHDHRELLQNKDIDAVTYQYTRSYTCHDRRHGRESGQTYLYAKARIIDHC